VTTRAVSRTAKAVEATAFPSNFSVSPDGFSVPLYSDYISLNFDDIFQVLILYFAILSLYSIGHSPKV
jgi:hypothetical protein